MQISAEETQKLLKDLMFHMWSEAGCESTVDIIKLLSLIDFYLPFFPLERRHIWELFEAKLKHRQDDLQQTTNYLLQWDGTVTDFLASKASSHPCIQQFQSNRWHFVSFRCSIVVELLTAKLHIIHSCLTYIQAIQRLADCVHSSSLAICCCKVGSQPDV